MRTQSLVALAALVLLACGRDDGLPPTATTEIKPAAAQAVLALSLPDIGGTPQALSQWRGKILVINYWASWCPPCKEEMPAFSRLHEQYMANGVQFVGISIDSVDNVRKFQAQTPVSYPLLLGSMETMRTAVDLGNSAQGLPFTVILDREGEVYASKLGRLSETVLKQRLDTLLKQ